MFKKRKSLKTTDPIDARRVSFFDRLFDLYTPPDMVRLRVPPSGREGLEQDARAIRGYFDAAIGKVHVKTE